MKLILRGLAVIIFLFGGLSFLALLLMVGIVFLWSFDPGSTTKFSMEGILSLLGLTSITAASFIVGKYLWKRSNTTPNS